MHWSRPWPQEVQHEDVTRSHACARTVGATGRTADSRLGPRPGRCRRPDQSPSHGLGRPSPSGRQPRALGGLCAGLCAASATRPAAAALVPGRPVARSPGPSRSLVRLPCAVHRVDRAGGCHRHAGPGAAAIDAWRGRGRLSWPDPHRQRGALRASGGIGGWPGLLGQPSLAPGGLAQPAGGHRPRPGHRGPGGLVARASCGEVAPAPDQRPTARRGARWPHQPGGGPPDGGWPHPGAPGPHRRVRLRAYGQLHCPAPGDGHPRPAGVDALAG